MTQTLHFSVPKLVHKFHKLLVPLTVIKWMGRCLMSWRMLKYSALW